MLFDVGVATLMLVVFVKAVGVVAVEMDLTVLGVGVAVLLDMGVAVLLDMGVAVLLDVGVAVLLDVGVAVLLDVGVGWQCCWMWVWQCAGCGWGSAAGVSVIDACQLSSLPPL